MMAIESALITGDMIEAAEFQQLSNKYFVSAVPKVVINGEIEFEGTLPEKSYLEKIFEAEGTSRKSYLSEDKKKLIPYTSEASQTLAIYMPN